ncbi:MAG TPA: LutB/LldF family L-lactate oxidation iron-sulfur protein [Thermoleophilaceae bacterium]
MDRVVAPGATPERGFPEAAHETLADETMRRNLALATSTIRAKRAGVVAELPDWEELREAGARVKDRAMMRLDEELERLEEAFARAGGIVHWARDGEEACRIVADVARAHGASEVVKVKSIATDEIGLNEALAAAGVASVETDLAELIVQLAGDRQSHILVPAIHFARREIRDLFRSELGLPDLTDEPAELAAAAREHLRRKFLDARVGVSGANFAVAETGTVCVVESEGNGRMCTTLPEVLVTVMGVEKVVPAWRDMEVFLQLLPRSSTGERMNPYTSFWSGAREGDGPREVHLVLLDNGRTRALRDRVGRQALRCIRCSACLNVCPVYSRVGGHAYGSVYPGPIGAILTPQLVGVEGPAGTLPFASSLCGACAEVCPVKIEIPELLVHLRARSVEARSELDPERLSMRALGRLFRSRRGYERAQRLGRAAQRPLVRDGLIRRAPGPLAAWTRARDLAPVADETFREWWRRERAAAPPAGSGPARAAGGTPVAGPSGGTPAAGPPPAAASTDPSPRGVGRFASKSRTLPGPPPGGESQTPFPPASDTAASAFHARDEVLARVRRALGSDRSEVEVPRAYRLRDGSAREEIVARFEERVGEYRATVRRAGAGAGDVGEVLTRLCEERGGGRLGVPAGLPDAWAPDGVELVPDSGLSAHELDGLDGALTGAALGIAETGTIVLDGEAGQGRRVLTLVPDWHVCVVDEDTIVGLVPEAVARLEEAVRAGRPLTFVSGPSATSDIELNRVEGVHGPRTLDVVILGRG